MIIVKKGKGCGIKPLLSSTLDRKDRSAIDVEAILDALFCNEDKNSIIKRFEITEEDFEEAMTFAMYAVSQFNGKEDLAWDKNHPDNIYSSK